MVREGAVNGGRSDLHHFEAVRAFEHAMPDFRGLEDEIAGIQNEWCALTLIDHADPPASDVKRLSSDPMEMHPVDDRASFGNGDVRCNVAAAQAIGDQVAVQHAARPSLAALPAHVSTNPGSNAGSADVGSPASGRVVSRIVESPLDKTAL